MSDLSRRDLVIALSALAAAPLAEAQAVAVPPGTPALDKPRVFLHANGSETRAVLHGTLPTGEAVEIHETTIPPGATPNPPHQHRPSDFMFVREGTVAFEHDGKSEHAGPGSVIFAASQTNHTLRNVGEVPARYFVISIGREATKQLV
jgi:mannose-6-phosphate isomerase-like protein (cupin superfamily)